MHVCVSGRCWVLRDRCHEDVATVELGRRVSGDGCAPSHSCVFPAASCPFITMFAVSCLTHRIPPAQPSCTTKRQTRFTPPLLQSATSCFSASLTSFRRRHRRLGPMQRPLLEELLPLAQVAGAAILASAAAGGPAQHRPPTHLATPHSMMTSRCSRSVSTVEPQCCDPIDPQY